MTARREVYICLVCGNVVEVLRPGGGTLVCCKQPMVRADENTTDASHEKHVPVIRREAGQATVAVGSVAHPMASDHYIEWIELLDGETVMRQYLQPGSEPAATFPCPEGTVTARAYCNLHGLWKAQG